MSGLDRRLTCFCMYDITTSIHHDVSGHWNARKYFNRITSLIVSNVSYICNWSSIPQYSFRPSTNWSTIGTAITMPGENIDRPNPQPLPSHIPDSINELQVRLQNTCLDQSACDSLYKFRRAAAYIAAGAQPFRYWIEVDNWPWLAMIFLQDNTLLKRDIKHEDIKPRLLGKQLTFSRIGLLLTCLRPLGNMSRADSRLFSPELFDQATWPWYTLRCWSRTWCTRYLVLSLVRRLPGAILSTLRER